MCQSIQPPTQQLKKCRYILKGLAGGLFVLAVLAVVARQFMQIFLFGLLAFLLYISWAQFLYFTVLMYFIFSGMQAIQSIFSLIWLIQFHNIFQGKYVQQSILVVVQVIYFIAGFILSHYVYKHLKHWGKQNGMGANMFPNMGNPGNAAQNNIQNPLIGGQLQQQQQNQNQNQNQRNNANNDNNNPFKGRGVMIG